MILALWDAICKMEYFYNDGKYIIYLQNAIHNKFLELYRGSRKRFDNEIIEVSEINNEIIFNEKYSDIDLREYILIYTKRYKGNKQKIAKKY
ncbi:MAG: hypothetical protein HFH68_14330 [Lachnospiraceae bacterium]|nr:hypothetical protein [Lachnospiraceae bacterium]